jgi:hypothetical protein
MKAFVHAIALSCAMALPMLASAQIVDTSTTRAAVRADLARLEEAGYRPSASATFYPNDIQAAEAKVAANHTSAVNGVGGVASESYQSGSSVVTPVGHTLYSGH